VDDSEDEESDDSNEGDVNGDNEDEEHADEDTGEPSPPRSRSPTPNLKPSYPTFKIIVSTTTNHYCISESSALFVRASADDIRAAVTGNT
jgi:hypothetical protein